MLTISTVRGVKLALFKLCGGSDHARWETGIRAIVWSICRDACQLSGPILPIHLPKALGNDTLSK